MLFLIVGGALVAAATGLSIAVGKAQAGPRGSVDARDNMEPDQLQKLLFGQMMGIIWQEVIEKKRARAENREPDWKKIKANQIKLATSGAKTAQMLGMVKTAAGLLTVAEAWKQGKSGSEVQEVFKLENWPGTDQTVLEYLMANRPPELHGW